MLAPAHGAAGPRGRSRARNAARVTALWRPGPGTIAWPLTGGHGGAVLVDVFAVDVDGAGLEGCAGFAASVALFEAVELVFGAEGVEEAHCSLVRI